MGCTNCRFYCWSKGICEIRDGYFHNWQKAGVCPDFQTRADYEHEKFMEKVREEKESKQCH